MPAKSLVKGASLCVGGRRGNGLHGDGAGPFAASVPNAVILLYVRARGFAGFREMCLFRSWSANGVFWLVCFPNGVLLNKKCKATFLLTGFYITEIKGFRLWLNFFLKKGGKKFGGRGVKVVILHSFSGNKNLEASKKRKTRKETCTRCLDIFENIP